jgi:hypothetical protein
MSSVNCPGTATCIRPPHKQLRVHVLSNAGCLPSRTVVAPGIQGDMVTGIHGCGVRTPKAADVAAATAGLAKLMHIPNGAIFTIGLWSMIVAAGWLLVITLLTGKTVNWLGATPKLHLNMAPLQTCCGMVKLLRYIFDPLVRKSGFWLSSSTIDAGTFSFCISTKYAS